MSYTLMHSNVNLELEPRSLTPYSVFFLLLCIASPSQPWFALPWLKQANRVKAGKVEP